MKIMVVQDRLRSGGTERQSILLANAFAAAGHEASLLTFRPGGDLRPTVSAQVSVQSLQPADTGLDWYAPFLASSVARAKPDVVLAMGRMANCYAGGLQGNLREKRGLDTAVIATMRTGKTLPALFRKSLQTVRHVVANSREARDHLVSDYAVDPARISVIHNALVFDRPPPAAGTREATRALHGAKPGTAVLLCVAMFRPEKNQAGLIDVLSGLSRETDWQLWLPGDGPTRAECELIAGERGLADRVRFLGWQADPGSLYAAADVAVHASWSESLSNFLIEAQASGLPAVVYAAQGVGECFVPGVTGEVIPRDQPDQFRAAVMKYTGLEPAKRAALAARARDYAHKTFDPKHQVQAYLDLFGKLRT